VTDADDVSRTAGAETLVDPTAEAVHALFERRLDGETLVTVSGRCTVEYEGACGLLARPG
jgi:RecB family endonuclease NucS